VCSKAAAACPRAAIRDFQSKLAGKPRGTSSIVGRKLVNVTVKRMNRTAASKKPFQTPNCRVSRRPS
jgi:hypothetical protein